MLACSAGVINCLLYLFITHELSLLEIRTSEGGANTNQNAQAPLVTLYEEVRNWPHHSPNVTGASG